MNETFQEATLEETKEINKKVSWIHRECQEALWYIRFIFLIILLIFIVVCIRAL